MGPYGRITRTQVPTVSLIIVTHATRTFCIRTVTRSRPNKRRLIICVSVRARSNAEIRARPISETCTIYEYNLRFYVTRPLRGSSKAPNNKTNRFAKRKWKPYLFKLVATYGEFIRFRFATETVDIRPSGR